MLHEAMNPILVSHDRGGCRISISTNMLPSEIKRMLNTVADEGKNIYVPSEITQGANCYSFYIRQRQSVKEYLIQNECTISDYMHLIQSLADIVSLCSRLNLNIYDFVFDYSCIYAGSSLKTAEYVYAPGGNIDKQYNSIANMLTIASLHIQCDDSIKETNALKEATRLLIEWERDLSNPLPLEEILVVLDIEQRNEKVIFTTWKPFLYFQFGMLLFFIFILLLIPFKESGVFVWIAWLLLMVSIDYILIPGKKLKNLKFISEQQIEIKGYDYLKGQVFYFNKGIINVGRDCKWADLVIKHILVSRHHATIFCKEGCLYIKDLNSKNGIYVNGVRIKANEEVLLKKGNVISVGDGMNRLKVIKY